MHILIVSKIFCTYFYRTQIVNFIVFYIYLNVTKT